MSFPIARAQTNGTSATSPTWESWFSSQADNDIILIAAHNDAGTSALGIDVGWTELHGPAPSNSLSRTGVWWRRRTGGVDIAAPTLTGASAGWAVVAIKFNGIDATTAIDASAVTEQTAATATPTCPTATSVTNNAIVLRIVGRDGTNCPVPDEQFGKYTMVATVTDNDSATTAIVASLAVAQQFQETAGAVGTFAFRDAVSDGGRQMTVVLRPAVGATKPLFTKPATNAHVLFPIPTTQYSTVTDISTVFATISGETVQTATASVAAVTGTGSISDVEAGIVGAFSELRSSQAATPSGPAGWYGAFASLAASVDFSANLFGAVLRIPADNQRATDTPVLLFGDGSGNYALVRTASRIGYNTFTYHLAHLPSLSTVETVGTIDWSAVTKIGFAKYATANGTASARVQEMAIKHVFAVPVATPLVTIHGEGVGVSDIHDVFKSLGVGSSMSAIQGGVQLLSKMSIQLGDTASPVGFVGEGASIAFATSSGSPGYGARDGDTAIRFEAGASDSISIDALSIVSQGSTVDMDVDSAATIGGLTGSAVFIGMIPDLSNSQDMTGARFIDCAKVLAYGGTLDQCSIKSTRATDAALSASVSGGGFTGGSIDLTGATCSYHVELGSSVTAFDLAGATLAGTAGTNNIHVLRTTGTVTITLAQGQTVPTYTTDGATVAFDQPVLDTSWTNEDLADGTVVLVRNVTSSTTIDFATVSGGVGYTISMQPGVDYTVGDVIEVRQSRQSGTTYWIERTSTIITTAGGGDLVEADDLESCTICNAFSKDGADYESDFSLDSTNDELDIDVSGPWEASSLMVYWKYKMTQQAPMEEFWRAWDVQTDGSFRNDVSIMSSYLDNTTSADANESTGRRVHRSDGARPVKADRLIDVSWRDPVTVVATGSGVLPADITAIGAEVATRSQAGELHADVRWVNDVAVDGTGTEGDPWGPV